MTVLEVAELSIWMYPDAEPVNAMTPDIEIGDTFVHPEFPDEKAVGDDPEEWKAQAVALAERHGWRVANGMQWRYDIDGGYRWRIRIVRDVADPVRLSVTVTAWDCLTFAVGPVGGEPLVSKDVDRFAYVGEDWQGAAAGWARDNGYRWLSGCSWHPVKDGHVTSVVWWR